MRKVEEMLTNLWLGAGLKNATIHLKNMHKTHKSIMKRTVDQTKFNPKIFHSYIKYQKVRHPTVGSFRTTEDKIIDEPKSMVNSFLSCICRYCTTLEL